MKQLHSRLGQKHGSVLDGLTQWWVRCIGKKVLLYNRHWLRGPMGETKGIGAGYFEQLSGKTGFTLRTNPEDAGLLPDFHVLKSTYFNSALIDPRVVDFYEHTTRFHLDVWSQWCGVFRPFGWLIAKLFSRRLQQLNMPIVPRKSSRGITSDIIQIVDPKEGILVYTGWLRTLIGSGNVLYAGCYGTADVPGFSGACVKVVFPLPNGNATVIMKPVVGENGTLELNSSGRKFGDPGFYFIVMKDALTARVRYVRAFRETIRVYADEDGQVCADHTLTFFKLTCLKLHYRMRREA